MTCAAGFPAGGWWFPSTQRPGLPVGSQSVSRALVRVMERAKIHGTAHWLRHTFATAQMDNGANLREVQANMRHSSLTSTQIYTLVSNEAQRAAIMALPVPWHEIRSRAPRRPR